MGSEEDQNSAEQAEEHDTMEVEPATDLVEDEVDDLNEAALNGISDPETRAKIRKLHSAFPNSHLAVCKYILNGKGVEGDVGEAYEVLARGFHPVKPKSEITESLQGNGKGPAQKSRTKSRSKSKSPAVEQEEEEDDETPNELFKHYDQHGLPPGSIKSGKALSFMAEAAKSSPDPRPTSAGSSSGSRLVKFSEEEGNEEGLLNGLTSTPAIEKESQQILAEIFNNTSEQLTDPTLNFWPIIADDMCSLREQANTLVDWCQGFLMGLGLSSVQTSDEQVLEMIKDISEISQLEVDLLDNEENAQDFYEIVEFVRMGVLFIQETLQPSKQDFISPTQLQ